MFELIGLALGAFLGVLVADFLRVLDPVRATIREVIATAYGKVQQLVGNLGNNPLLPIGVLVLVVVLAFWLLGFSSAMLLGLVFGVVYQEEVGRLPFVSGLVETVRSKISGPK